MFDDIESMQAEVLPFKHQGEIPYIDREVINQLLNNFYWGEDDLLCLYIEAGAGYGKSKLLSEENIKPTFITPKSLVLYLFKFVVLT